MKTTIYLSLLSVLLFGVSGKVLSQARTINKDASPLELSFALKGIDDINPTTIESHKAFGAGLVAKGQLVTYAEASEFLIDYSVDLSRLKLTDNDDQLLDDNYQFNSYQVKILTRFHMSEALYLDTELRHSSEAQMFGEGISQLRNNVINVDKLEHNSVATTLFFGNDALQRNVSLKVMADEYEYAPNNVYSSLFDMSSYGAELNVGFQKSALSGFSFRLSGTKEDYVDDIREDSYLYRALLGVNWSPSGKTDFNVLFGGFWRDNERSSSTSGLSWIVNFYTRPSENWKLEFSTTRFSNVSSSEITSNSVRQNARLQATYDYSERWAYGAEFDVSETEFIEENQITTLSEQSAQIFASLSLKDHSDVRLTWGRVSKEFKSALIDYSQSEVGLTWHLIL